MLPAFTSAHSHAFQIGLRGSGERFPAGVADFWSWRQAMYGLVERMDPDLAYQLAHRCYWEMLQAGIRTVGEFHYLRHQVLGDSDFALDEAVIQAAHDAGIELVLLPAAYEEAVRGWIFSTAQRRFETGGFIGTGSGSISCRACCEPANPCRRVCIRCGLCHGIKCSVTSPKHTGAV